ncbi:MAG: deoxyribodipyrimidine photo-lyase/cryptochrome family protein [Rickettsiales bacterium]|nr:deoxyribodipyrimidine photo-lyase/cryptochrome family protein [Rickettsiales bacterium]
MQVNILWFKKDLRLYDNEALEIAASDQIPVILLFVIEPSLWHQDSSYRQYVFQKQALENLKSDALKLNYHINIVVNEALNIFAELNQKYQINKIISHQETGNMATYKRDINVKNWCKNNKVIWHEPVQNGVVRCLKDRDGWSRNWFKKMSEKQIKIPKNLQTIKFAKDIIPDAKDLNIPYDNIKNAQIGGRDQAFQYLNDFLYKNGENYTREMSSPVTAYTSCSRLSPYITFGCVSIKEVFQIASLRQKEISNLPKENQGNWPSAMRSFLGRLRWHCHFMQKLEDEPELEFNNLHPAYDALDRDDNSKYLQAWLEGNTGFPMIDASMRALIETGWINFRMRAMLVSFASYHLWLDWRITAKYLGKLFIDYEAGIHYSQIQMQSGTTGINAIRIYSPTKQVIDNDPKGIFIRKYIKGLKDISDNNIANPYNEPLLVRDYPKPIIEEKIARKHAADKIYNLRKSIGHKNIANAIVKKHGSRKSGLRRTAKKF